MSVRIVERGDGTIHIDDLEDGQLAEIVEWKLDHDIAGETVHRCGVSLIRVGERAGVAYLTFFDTPTDSLCRVRVLPNGTRLEVSNNE